MHRAAKLAPAVGDLAGRTRQARARQRVRRTVMAGGAGLTVLALAVAGAAWLPPGASPGQVAAASGASPGVLLMTQNAPTRYQDTAEKSGTLVLTDQGCLAIQSRPPGEVAPVVWPYGWTGARDDTGRVVLYNDQGRPVAHEGDNISVGGGILGDAHQWRDHPCATREPWLAGPDLTTRN